MEAKELEELLAGSNWQVLIPVKPIGVEAIVRWKGPIEEGKRSIHDLRRRYSGSEAILENGELTVTNEELAAYLTVRLYPDQKDLNLLLGYAAQLMPGQCDTKLLRDLLTGENRAD